MLLGQDLVGHRDHETSLAPGVVFWVAPGAGAGLRTRQAVWQVKTDSMPAARHRRCLPAPRRRI